MFQEVYFGLIGPYLEELFAVLSLQLPLLMLASQLLQTRVKYLLASLDGHPCPKAFPWYEFAAPPTDHLYLELLSLFLYQSDQVFLKQGLWHQLCLSLLLLPPFPLRSYHPLKIIIELQFV